MKLRNLLQRIGVIVFLVCVSWCTIRGISQNGNVDVYGTEVWEETWKVQNNGFQDIHYRAGFVTDTQQEYRFQVKDMEVPTDAIINVAVWSEENGQDDISWTAMTKEFDGNFSTKIKISDYKSLGMYHAHMYYFPEDETPQLLLVIDFEVEAASGGIVETIETDTKKGTSVFKISNIKSAPSGIAGVEVKVWSSANKGEEKIYQAVQKDDAWYATMDISNHNYNWGIYQADVYAVDGNGLKTYIGNGNTVFEVEGATMTTQMDNTKTVLSASFSELLLPAGVNVMLMAMWSEENGQDDLTWHTVETTDGWKKEIDLAFLKNIGKCHLHVYVQKVNGEMVLVTEESFRAEAPDFGGTMLTKVYNDTGKFEIRFGEIPSSDKKQEVEVEVWSQMDKNDLKTYVAMKQNNGTYSVISDISVHNYNIGTYFARVKVVDECGESNILTNTTFEIVSQIAQGSVKSNQDEGYYEIYFDEMTYPGGLNSVMYAVWSEENDQDDLHWYTANHSDNGYFYTVDIRNHKTLGKYAIHVYGVDNAGRMIFLNAISGMNVEKIPEDPIVVNKVTRQGTFEAVISNLVGVMDVAQVRAAVWTSEKGQDDIYWYDCEKQENGKYIVPINIKNHHYNTGTYVVHVYVVKNDQTQYLSCDCTYVYNPDNLIYVTGKEGTGERTINIKNVTNTNKLSFAVWSEEKGQDDLIWYDAKSVGDGTWQALVKASSHKDAGIYNVHTYGGMSLLSNVQFTFAKEELQVKNISKNNDISNESYLWPVPSSKRITSYFGYRKQPTAGASRLHKGIDIGAAKGSIIVASKSGVVTASAYNSSRGNYVEITHADGVVTIYMHMNSRAVSKGTRVSRGQTIGYVGSTGISTGPHLHFSVVVNGVNQNPLNYVSR